MNLDVDKWNERKIQSSVCYMIMSVYEDVHIRMPRYILERLIIVTVQERMSEALGQEETNDSWYAILHSLTF